MLTMMLISRKMILSVHKKKAKAEEEWAIRGFPGSNQSQLKREGLRSC